MTERDPQWQAVIEARKLLKADRYWSREGEAQRQYLGDVTELARELAFILTQAGITWTDVETASNPSSPALQRMVEAGNGRLEYALCRAVDLHAERSAEATS